ncbi:hypothetical protein WBP07_21350 (plasmid) [Novosphingobium sp. BL-8A]
MAPTSSDPHETTLAGQGRVKANAYAYAVEFARDFGTREKLLCNG